MKLLDGWNIYDTFNVGHLHSYFDEFEEQNSRASSFSEEGIDDVEYQDIGSDLQPSLEPRIDEENIEEDYYNKAEHPKITKVYFRRNKPQKFPNLDS